MGAVQMAKMGRPPKGHDHDATELIRVPKRIAQMVRWLTRVEGIEASKMLGGILDKPISERYNRHLAVITVMKAAEDTARADAGLPPTEPLPVVINVTDTMTFEELRAATAKIDQANEANRLERLRAEAEGIEVKGKKKGKRE